MNGRIGYLFCLTCLWKTRDHREPTLEAFKEGHLEEHPEHEVQYRMQR